MMHYDDLTIFHHHSVLAISTAGDWLQQTHKVAYTQLSLLSTSRCDALPAADDGSPVPRP